MLQLAGVGALILFLAGRGKASVAVPKGKANQGQSSADRARNPTGQANAGVDAQYAQAITRLGLSSAPPASELPLQLKDAIVAATLRGHSTAVGSLQEDINRWNAAQAKLPALSPAMQAWLVNELGHALGAFLGVVPIVGGLAGKGLQLALASKAGGSVGVGGTPAGAAGVIQRQEIAPTTSSHFHGSVFALNLQSVVSAFNAAPADVQARMLAVIRGALASGDATRVLSAASLAGTYASMSPKELQAFMGRGRGRDLALGGADRALVENTFKGLL